MIATCGGMLAELGGRYRTPTGVPEEIAVSTNHGAITFALERDHELSPCRPEAVELDRRVSVLSLAAERGHQAGYEVSAYKMHAVADGANEELEEFCWQSIKRHEDAGIRRGALSGHACLAKAAAAHVIKVTNTL